MVRVEGRRGEHHFVRGCQALLGVQWECWLLVAAAWLPRT